MSRRKTGPDKATVDLVRQRDRDQCRRCHGNGEQIHHRRPRGMGGTRDPLINATSNLVLLCSACHLHVETHRTEAFNDGWLVSQHSSRLPSAIPLVVHGLPVWLDDNGNTHPMKEIA